MSLSADATKPNQTESNQIKRYPDLIGHLGSQVVRGGG